MPGGGGEGGDSGQLAAYLREPTPGTVVVLESSRYGFEGEDKAKLERVQKHFAAIPAQVEFRPFSPEAVRSLAQALAKKTGLQLGLAELAMLLDATGGDASRIAVALGNRSAGSNASERSTTAATSGGTSLFTVAMARAGLSMAVTSC